MTDFDLIAKGMSAAVPFAGHLDLEIVEVSEGEATVLLPDRPELKNHVGSQHAGALFTAAETASGAAFVGAFAERIANGTITAKARLGVPAAQALETLDAEGKVEFPCEIEMTDANGTVVAAANVRWHVRLK